MTLSNKDYLLQLKKRLFNLGEKSTISPTVYKTSKLLFEKTSKLLENEENLVLWLSIQKNQNQEINLKIIELLENITNTRNLELKEIFKEYLHIITIQARSQYRD